ncbi:MAG TPA: flagellar assembly protein FliH [Bacillales bacterium]|nr:flagellar assembly protein FliH [Bacillales bacterium]
MSNIIKMGNANKSSANAKKIHIANMQLFEKPSDSTDLSNSPETDAVPVLKKAEIQANNLIKNAQLEADKILNNARAEQERMKAEAEKAYEKTKSEGWEEGYALGLQTGKEQYEELLSEARKTVISANSEYRKRLLDAENDILQLAVHIAEKITRQTISQQSQSWLNIVKNAMSEVKEHEEIRLIVHPKYFDFVMSHKKELDKLLKKNAELFIYPESVKDEHHCVIEYPLGRIDASVDRQLSEIKRALLDQVEAR